MHWTIRQFHGDGGSFRFAHCMQVALLAFALLAAGGCTFLDTVPGEAVSPPPETAPEPLAQQPEADQQTSTPAPGAEAAPPETEPGAEADVSEEGEVGELPEPATGPPEEVMEAAESGFAGPLLWKSWTRTHIFGKYKPLASIFKGKRRKASGRRYYHQGLDVLCPRGTKVVAPADGVVVRAGSWNSSGYGKALLVEVATNEGNLYVLYAHLDRLLVRKGERVQRGEVIALSGKSGNASRLAEAEEHVHIEVRTREKVSGGLDGRADPLKYFTDIVPPRELGAQEN
jgi:murein DD-endopeptidase MepM/ murein hydrolase activator NlpD